MSVRACALTRQPIPLFIAAFSLCSWVARSSTLIEDLTEEAHDYDCPEVGSCAEEHVLLLQRGSPQLLQKASQYGVSERPWARNDEAAQAFQERRPQEGVAAWEGRQAPQYGAPERSWARNDEAQAFQDRRPERVPAWEGRQGEVQGQPRGVEMNMPVLTQLQAEALERRGGAPMQMMPSLTQLQAQALARGSQMQMPSLTQFHAEGLAEGLARGQREREASIADFSAANGGGRYSVEVPSGGDLGAPAKLDDVAASFEQDVGELRNLLAMGGPVPAGQQQQRQPSPQLDSEPLAGVDWSTPPKGPVVSMLDPLLHRTGASSLLSQPAASANTATKNTPSPSHVQWPDTHWGSGPTSRQVAVSWVTVFFFIFVLMFCTCKGCASVDPEHLGGPLRGMVMGFQRTGDRLLPGAGVQTAEQEAELHKTVGFSEDTYGIAICMFVRDTAIIASGRAGNLPRRILRLGSSIALLIVTVAIQLYLILKIVELVLPPTVTHIQELYSRYEMHMYNNNTYLTYLGEHRGYRGFFVADNFNSFERVDKEEICSIPFSQQGFFLCVLFIWSLTCVGELKASVELFSSLIVMTPTIDSMTDSLEPDENDPDENDERIKGLTMPVKAVIIFVFIIPRMCVTTFLLWLGCRWLASTTSFADVVMNSIALEFILCLKDLIYNTLVTDRSKRDLESTTMNVPLQLRPNSLQHFLVAAMWGAGALIWSMFYLYTFQFLLVEYNWDIKSVCEGWLPHAYDPHFFNPANR